MLSILHLFWLCDIWLRFWSTSTRDVHIHATGWIPEGYGQGDALELKDGKRGADELMDGYVYVYAGTMRE